VFKKSLRLPVHPERVCWGCDRYCPANDLACGNGTVRAQHPAELFGADWEQYSAAPAPPPFPPPIVITHAMQRVTEYLISDHARLHELLERARSGSALERGAFAAFRAGLLRHIGIEEKLLFPAVRNALAGVPLAGALELRVDHAAIASLLVPTPDLALATELADLLARHDGAEECPEGVYEQCEQILGEERSRALAEQARATGEVPVAAHYDGPTVHRTAAAALAAARRTAAARGRASHGTTRQQAQTSCPPSASSAAATSSSSA
jgi:hypothetical protein